MSENTAINRTHNLDRNGLECKLDVTMDGSVISTAYREKIQEILHHHRMRGFRKGRIPQKLIEQRYGPDVLKEVAGEFADKSLQEAVEKEGITLAGPPKVTIENTKVGEDLTYHASFEVLPEFDLPDLKKLSLKIQEVSMDSKDEKAAVEKVLADNPEWVDSKKAAAKGDKVVVDFAGTIDGVAFDGGTAQGSEFTLGQKQMLPDFEAGVLGKKAGETVTVSCQFPGDYHAENLRGKQAEFSITLQSVRSPKKAKLDKAFVERVGKKEQAVEDYKKSLLETQAKECGWVAERLHHNGVMAALDSSFSFAVPKILADQEVAMMKKDPQHASGGHDDAALQAKAEKNIRLTLVVRKLVDHFALKVDQTKVTEYLTKMAPDFIDPQAFVAWYEKDQERMERVKVAVLEQQVVEKVLQESGAKKEKLSLSAAQAILEKE